MIIRIKFSLAPKSPKGDFLIVKRKNVFTFYTFTAPSELVPDIFREGWGQKSISSVHFADNH